MKLNWETFEKILAIAQRVSGYAGQLDSAIEAATPLINRIREAFENTSDGALTADEIAVLVDGYIAKQDELDAERAKRRIKPEEDEPLDVPIEED